jgi:hypothetical protein
MPGSPTAACAKANLALTIDRDKMAATAKNFVMSELLFVNNLERLSSDRAGPGTVN